MTFHKTLRALLRDRGITAAALARAIHCSPQTISDWLAGGRSPRDLEAVRRCAEHFQVSLHFLLFGEEEAHAKRAVDLGKFDLAGLYEVRIQKIRGTE